MRVSALVIQPLSVPQLAFEACYAGFYHVADAWIAAGFPLEAAEILEAMRQAQCFRLVAAAEASGGGLPCGPS